MEDIWEKIGEGKQEQLLSLISQKYNEKCQFGKYDVEEIEAWADVNINSSGGITHGSNAIELQN
ncbi:MAG: hypothetical protein NY202_03235 [Mollicutes bacterium UO1]